MISDVYQKTNVRLALEKECTDNGLSFNSSDLNSDLCAKINIYYNS